VETRLDKVSNDGKLGIISEGDDLLVNHESKDSELGGTAVVELDGTLGELGFLIERVPAKVNVSVSEITNEFISSSFNVTHDSAFEETNERDQLDKSSRGDGVGTKEGSNSIGVRGERVTRVVNVSWKMDSSTGGDLSQKGQLTDTSMLDLDVTKTVESFFIGTVQDAHGIPKAKGGLNTKFTIEGRCREGSGLWGRSRGGGKGRSRGEKGGKDGELHL
jgi:hypothetical protein